MIGGIVQDQIWLRAEIERSQISTPASRCLDPARDPVQGAGSADRERRGPPWLARSGIQPLATESTWYSVNASRPQGPFS
jgi:hypothetical protein